MDKKAVPGSCYICNTDMNNKDRYAVILPSLDSCAMCVPKVVKTNKFDAETELVIYKIIHKISEFPKFVDRERCICETCLVAASVEEVLHFYKGKITDHLQSVVSEGHGSLGVGEGVSLGEEYLKELNNMEEE